MANGFPNEWWNEFEALGEDDVRKRLGAVVWDAHKQVAARQWLEGREAARLRRVDGRLWQWPKRRMI
jgi:hypothetical protein